MGLFAQARYDEEVIVLEAGDLVIVFSDGVSEATAVSGEEFGDDRIIGCIQKNPSGSPEQLLECLLASVKAFCAGALQSDDVTALIMRIADSRMPLARLPAACSAEGRPCWWACG